MFGNLSGATLLVIFGIWSLIGLAFFVWYLFAMARLFPKIGLPAGQGWIPLWNEWKLIDRAGLPGWTVLSYFVPGLGIVAVIFRTIAMQRVNTQAGVGAGYTVLGFFIPPLWATLLGNVIGDRVIAPGQAQAYSAYPESPAYSAPAATGYAPPAFDGGQVSGDQAGVQASGVEHALPPVPADGFAAAGFAAAGADPHAAPEPSPLDALWAPSADPWAPKSSNSALPAQVGPPPPPPLGNTTEREYERLANEPFQAPPAAPLGRAVAPEPFSWTAASQPRETAPPAFEPTPPPIHPLAAPAAAESPASAVPAAPARPAASAAPAAPAAPPVVPAPPVSPVVPAPPAVPDLAAPPAVPDLAAPPAPPAFAPPAPAAPPTEPTPAPTRAVRRPTGITEIPVLPDVEVDDRTIVTGSGPTPEDDLDRTIVVSRAPAFDWVLELPDGELLALTADTIVGRRPSEVAGASALLIPDSTRTLSKSHARLRFDGEAWSVEDLGSTNGLRLLHDEGGEVEVEPGVAVVATPRLMLGTLEVRLRRAGDGA